MKLSTVLSHLATGEYSHLYTCDDTDQTIMKSEYPRVIPLINMALIELYKRFDVKTGELIIDLYEHITEYHLIPEFAQSNTQSNQIIKYINDSGTTPYSGDLLSVKQVFNEYGDELPLGYLNDPSSLIMLDYNIIQHPYPRTGQAISVMYRANPPSIPVTANADFDINLSEIFLPALVLYVGSRVLTTRSNPDDVNQGAMLYNRFVQDILLIQNQGLSHTTTDARTQFTEQGWA